MGGRKERVGVYYKNTKITKKNNFIYIKVDLFAYIYIYIYIYIYNIYIYIYIHTHKSMFKERMTTTIKSWRDYYIDREQKKERGRYSDH